MYAGWPNRCILYTCMCIKLETVGGEGCQKSFHTNNNNKVEK